MLCKNCKLKIICKVHEFMNNQTFIDYSIDSCNLFNGFSDNVIKKEEKELNSQHAFDNSFERINKKPNLKKIEESVNPKKKIKLKKIKCPTCEGTTYEDDIKLCVKCGKKTCSNCGTLYNNIVYCNDCWKEI